MLILMLMLMQLAVPRIAAARTDNFLFLPLRFAMLYCVLLSPRLRPPCLGLSILIE